MNISDGAVCILEDQGDGWFPLAPGSSLRGTVLGVIEEGAGGAPYVLLNLDEPLEIQESAGPTHGFRLETFRRLLVRPRSFSDPLHSGLPRSVHVCLVPDDRVMETAEQCRALPVRIWATCSVVASAPGVA